MKNEDPPLVFDIDRNGDPVLRPRRRKQERDHQDQDTEPETKESTDADEK